MGTAIRSVSDEAPTREYADRVVILATWRSVLIARWLDVPTAATMRDVRRIVRATVGRSGAAFAAINLVESQQATSLAEDVRAEVTSTQREFAGQQRALATVIMGDGFWAATVRSVASGLALVARTPYPQRVFDAPGAAARWTAERMPDLGAAHSRGLELALSDVRAWG